MSAPRVSPVHLLIDPEPAQNPLITFEELVQKCTQEALAASPRPQETGCLLRDIGSYIIHANKIMTRIADNLVAGQHIAAKASVVWDEAKGETGYADMSSVEDFEQTHRVLTELGKVLREHSDDASNLWATAPKPPVKRCRLPRMPYLLPGPMELSPSARSSFSTSSSASTSTNFLPVKEESQLSPSVVSHRGFASPNPGESSSSSSPQSTSARIGLTEGDIEALRNRGKSTYKCPRGFACNKGGVDKSGNLVVFERHCMIRQHMEKHTKPYRCDRPGCPNKGGFARKDQLERHLKLVKHDKVP